MRKRLLIYGIVETALGVLILWKLPWIVRVVVAWMRG